MVTSDFFKKILKVQNAFSFLDILFLSIFQNPKYFIEEKNKKICSHFYALVLFFFKRNLLANWCAFYGCLFVTGFSFHGSFLVSTEHIWSQPSTTLYKSSPEARGGAAPIWHSYLERELRSDSAYCALNLVYRVY